LWHWVLPRQEAEWRRFLQLSGRGQRDFGVEVDAVVAHELAPIRLQGGDEAAAYLLAGIWPLRLSGLKIDTIASENVGNCQRLGFLFGIVGSKFRKVRNILDERWHEV
jgi:hypothetical protein